MDDFNHPVIHCVCVPKGLLSSKSWNIYLRVKRQIIFEFSSQSSCDQSQFQSSDDELPFGGNGLYFGASSQTFDTKHKQRYFL